MFPVDIIYCVIKTIDKNDHLTLFKAAQLNKTWNEVVFKTYEDLKVAHKDLSIYLNSANVLPWYVLKTMDFKLNTWNDICLYEKVLQSSFMKRKLIDYRKISESSVPNSLRTETKDYKTLTLAAISFRVWYHMFTKVFDLTIPDDQDKPPSQNVPVMPMGGLAGALPGLLSMLTMGTKGKKKLPSVLEDLTLYILSEFRRDLLIDDRFIECCFKNKLEKTLSEIMEYRKFYRFNLTEDTLENTYLLLSAKNDNIDVFSNMLSRTEVTISHLEWITKNAPLPFLVSMAKIKRSIPRFDIMIAFLDDTLETKTWKQKDFFKRVRENFI